MSNTRTLDMDAIRARVTGRQPYGPYPDGVSTLDDIRALLDEIARLRDTLARITQVAGANTECGTCQATAKEAGEGE